MAQPTNRGSSLLHTLMGMQITATGSYAPPNVVTNQDLAKFDLDPEWILRRTGIRERRHAPPEMSTSDLCINSAQQCFERAGVSPQDIDLLVIGTVSPDWHIASTAAVVQDRLGMRCGAIEVASACAGFMYALCTAAQYIVTGASQRALVIGADCCSRVIHPQVPKTYLLFGDGGGAVILEKGTEKQGLLAYTLGTEGAGAEQLYIRMGGSKMPASHEAIDRLDHSLYMDGKAVYKWATRILSESIVEVLDQAQLKLEEIDLFIPHQANLRIIEAAADHLGIDREKIIVNVDRYGNTSGGSVPLALDEAYQAGRIKPGDKVLLSGFGAGLSWGTAIFAW
jgi:3-oxoacyl-[acyl-carrier-protein] synthase-3